MKSLRYRISLLLFATFILIGMLAGCATTYSFEQENPDVMARYLSMSSEKALAVFRISGSNYGYGYGENYDTIAEAKQRAMEECRNRQQARDDIQEPCHLYMVNNERVAKEESGGGN